MTAIIMKFIPVALSLPVLVYFYHPLVRFFPWINKDRYVRRVVIASNSYFHKKFIKTPFNQRMLFLPYCLRVRECPTNIDPAEGLLCPDDCNLVCQLGIIRKMALDLGYLGIHIVVSGKLHKKQNILRSRSFLMRQIELYRPRAVIGCLCTQDLREKYLSPKNLSSKGTFKKEGVSIIPQIALLAGRNCRQSSVDWEYLGKMIQMCD